MRHESIGGPTQSEVTRSILTALATFVVVWVIVALLAIVYEQEQINAVSALANSRLIYAVCERFSNDELIDLQTTHGLRLVLKDKSAQTVLDTAYQLKQQQIRNQCPKAMARAEAQFKF
jgi:hypothetical protein